MPKNRFYLSKECMFTAQGPQVLCFMDLEGSPHYRGRSCAICTGQASRIIILNKDLDISENSGNFGWKKNQCR